MLPHSGNPVVHAGASLDDASTVMILVHGRNAAPRNILDLFVQLDRPGVAALAPAAGGGTWYPHSFLAPREQNEPGISSGLFVLETLVLDLLERGFSAQNLVLLGFSQGACLSAEFAFRQPRLYGGVVVLSGGLIGPPGTTWTDAAVGSLDQVPIFLGCSDVDAHIPKERVLDSEMVFSRMGARVTRRLYPGMAHTVNDDEIAFVRSIIDDVSSVPRGI